MRMSSCRWDMSDRCRISSLPSPKPAPESPRQTRRPLGPSASANRRWARPEMQNCQIMSMTRPRGRRREMTRGKGNRATIKAALDALGPAPAAPLEPVMTCPEPTFEGLCKLFAVGQPSLGIFATEGGQFVGGHGMSDDAKLRTAAGLSKLWDDGETRRVRSGDGATRRVRPEADAVTVPGRRLAVHLMAQPDAAGIMLNDRLLADQGLLS